MVEKKPIIGNKVARPVGMRPPVGTGMTTKEVFAILRRHVLLVIISTALGFMAGGASWFLVRQYLPSYTARTYIEVMPPIETDPMNVVAAQVNRDIQYGYRVSMANLINQQSTLEELLRNDRVRATRWFAKTDRDIKKAFKNLNKNFSAYPHRDAQYVEVAMTCHDPREAALIVNEATQLFVASQGGTKRAEVSERLARLEERRNRVEREVADADRALEEVRKAWGIDDLESGYGRYWRHTIELELDNLKIQENDLNLSVKQIQAAIVNLDELVKGPINEQIEYMIERDPVMLSLTQQIAFQQAALSGRLTRFGENHRVVRQAQQVLDDIIDKRRLRKTEIAEQTRRANLENAQDTLIVMQKRFAELQSMREAITAKKKDLDLARIQYSQRVKIRDERTDMLNQIKEQVEKLRIMLNDPETPKVQLVGQAPEPLEMDSSRKWWVWFPTGTVLGFLFGIALSFLVEMINDLLRTPRDVTKFLHIPLLGVIPEASEDRQVKRVDLCNVVRQAPYSLISESYRRCRTSLEMSGSVGSLKTLLVTSGDAADGKTSVAVNLATAFATQEKKVLLIDGNFRRPHLQTLFPKMASEDMEMNGYEFGLSSALMGQCSFQNAIRRTGMEHLDVIDTGPPPSNPGELLSSEKMQELLKDQSDNYDYIIIDSAPILLVSDAKALAGLVDATVLVFNAAATRRGAAQRSIRELEDVDATIIGCVLLGVRSLKGGYFQEQYKSYRKYQKSYIASTA